MCTRYPEGLLYHTPREGREGARRARPCGLRQHATIAVKSLCPHRALGHDRRLAPGTGNGPGDRMTTGHVREPARKKPSPPRDQPTSAPAYGRATPGNAVLVAIALVAGCTLALQVLITRVVSAVLFYHFS